MFWLTCHSKSGLPAKLTEKITFYQLACRIITFLLIYVTLPVCNYRVAHACNSYWSAIRFEIHVMIMKQPWCNAFAATPYLKYIMSQLHALRKILVFFNLCLILINVSTLSSGHSTYSLPSSILEIWETQLQQNSIHLGKQSILHKLCFFTNTFKACFWVQLNVNTEISPLNSL